MLLKALYKYGFLIDYNGWLLGIKTLNECEKANLKFKVMRIEKPNEVNKLSAISQLNEF